MIYLSNHYDVGMAVNVVELLLKHGYIEKFLSEKSDYTYTNMTQVEIINAFANYKPVPSVMVRSKRFWRFSKARAVHQNHSIMINTRLISSFAALCGTIIHEVAHDVNAMMPLRPSLYFNHGSNSPKNKMDSVPYYVGVRVKRFVMELQYTGYNLPESIFKYLAVSHG